MQRFTLQKIIVISLLALCTSFAQARELLNVSYDVMRDFYKDLNPVFIKHWQQKTGETLTINMSHAGSTKQARAVADGLEADVLTMNQATDLIMLAKVGGVIAPDWNKKFPDNAAPFTSTTVFIVRKGNPKGIKDWSDLIKPGLQVIIPNPKTSGNGRYTYLAAWAYALNQPGGDEAKAQEFVGKIFKNVPVLDAGGRAASTTFMQRNIGDVLLTFENEAEMIAKEFGRGTLEVVYPSSSVLAEPPVAVVDRDVAKRGNKEVAKAYLDFLWTPQGQEIAAQNYLRPRNQTVFAKYAAQFPAMKLYTVEKVFGSWEKAQQQHFADGGTFDKIYQPGAK